MYGGKNGINKSMVAKVPKISTINNRPVGKQKQDIEAISHLFLHFNPYANRKSISEIT